jgi:hypothetical protein
MEAMSIESLLLSTWEEEGFIGKTRVPVGMSDIDVLAIHPAERRVRIGESKVRDGSQKIYVVDESSLAWIKQQTNKDFTEWMTDVWSRWMENLPLIWDENGRPQVPWMVPLADVNQIEVMFCCNLVCLCERQTIDESLNRASIRFLGKNPKLAPKVLQKDFVKSHVIPTSDVVIGLIAHAFRKIEAGYGRRFADLLKDAFRELHRYLRPALDRLPCDSNEKPLSNRKNPFHESIREKTALSIVHALGIEDEELRNWLLQK